MTMRRFPAVGDDQPLFIVKRDLSGGSNTRQHEQVISDNQATALSNVILDTAGQRSNRAGVNLSKSLGASTGTGLYGFDPEGGTPELLATETTKLSGCTQYQNQAQILGLHINPILPLVFTRRWLKP